MNVNIKNRSIRPKAVIFGLRNLKISPKESELFKKINPLGFILFERNCRSKQQLKVLVKNLKNLLSHNYPLIMIDQEGGRVARLKKPNWPTYKSAEFFGLKAKKDLNLAKKLVYENSKKIGQDLQQLGINVNCAPVLDIRYNFTHSVIGDRSFSNDPLIVSSLGKAYCDGLRSKGIIPIIKHMPGHGLSKVDSHKKTPYVLQDMNFLDKNDFLPFKKLRNEPFAMISHIVYSRIDSKLACESKIIIKKVIRDKIRFKGILISDDINMKAMTGSATNRIKMSMLCINFL